MNSVKIQSERVKSIQSSSSLTISAIAKEMVARGEPVIDLSIGEPDFNTPAHIVEAAYQAMLAGQTRYTAPAGTEALRQAVADKFRRENDLAYSAQQISIGNGAKQLLFNAFAATLEQGDEVIIPAPYWVSYADIVRLNGGVPVVINCPEQQGFKLTPQQLQAAFTERTRWVMFNSPCNPTGMIYTREEFAALGEVLLRHPDVLILSDEIYEHIALGNTPFVSFVQACPALKERTMVLNGVSKAYAMTGWRLGYAAGPQELIMALNKLQSQSTGCPSAISQAAALAALQGPQDFVREATAEYRARGELVVRALQSISGLTLAVPDGAFYAFPNCAAYLGKRTPQGQLISTDTELVRYLLEEGKVATVPGSAFGIDGYIRLSFATSRANLEVALGRIRDTLASLSQ
ncbi:aspartate aminotransferase [Pokkaliibacter plantistimulans]|uniref:Aminotransferase n=1 Tax=Pokkaliibacter plantistimulans TaxID=1635171 RepID=A0ABX5LQV4_9GAMM|nr:aspartate aminotransferase [Pokkaliibacter plantistimulans]